MSPHVAQSLSPMAWFFLVYSGPSGESCQQRDQIFFDAIDHAIDQTLLSLESLEWHWAPWDLSAKELRTYPPPLPLSPPTRDGLWVRVRTVSSEGFCEKISLYIYHRLVKPLTLRYKKEY